MYNFRYNLINNNHYHHNNYYDYYNFNHFNNNFNHHFHNRKTITIRERYILKRKATSFHCYFYAAIIISGGHHFNNNGDGPTSVEVLRSDGSPWCSLPDIPGRWAREGHTQSGLVACGGTSWSGTNNNCYTFSSGSWTWSHALSPLRWHHSAWSSPAGKR